MVVIFFSNVSTKTHMVWCGLRQVVRLPIPTKDCWLTSSVAKNERERKVCHALPKYKRKVCRLSQDTPRLTPILGYPGIYLRRDIFFTKWCRESGTVGCSTSDGYGLRRNQSKAGMCLEQGRLNLLVRVCVVQAIPQHSCSLIGLVPARIPIEHNVSNFRWIPRR